MFIEVVTGRDRHVAMIGVANIASVDHADGEQLAINTADGKVFRVPDLTLKDFREAIKSHKVLVVDLTGGTERGTRAERQARMSGENRAAQMERERAQAVSDGRAQSALPVPPANPSQNPGVNETLLTPDSAANPTPPNAQTVPGPDPRVLAAEQAAEADGAPRQDAEGHARTPRANPASPSSRS